MSILGSFRTRGEASTAVGETAASQQTWIKSLSIAGFRGISQLHLPRLGRVTLIAGKNGVGKTTVLEAMRVYACRGRLDTLHDILIGREELAGLRDDDGDPDRHPSLDRLFHQGSDSRLAIEIAPTDGEGGLKIEQVDLAALPRRQLELFDDEFDEGGAVLRVVFKNSQSYQPWRVRRRWHRSRFLGILATPIPCNSLGPGVLGSVELARLWDEVALRGSEALAEKALQLVSGERVERTATVGENIRGSGRRVVVTLAGHRAPVPLRSLGDGAARMFAVALAIANCPGGILLIDEAENGIHYSLQEKFWSMTQRAAEEHNVQVLATTHSKDTIHGFAAAALASPNIRCNLVRIGRRNGDLRAVDYSTEELETAAEQDIEVR